MKNLILMTFSFLFASTTFAQADFCKQHEANSTSRQAIHAVASALKYTDEQLCTLPTLADIYVDQTVLYNEANQPVEHTWVTLHYGEYSCQYFVRNDDQVITRKNCYDTW